MAKNIKSLVFCMLSLNAFKISKWRCGSRQLELGVGSSGTPLAVQKLRLDASTTRDVGSVPGLGLRSQVGELRFPHTGLPW